MNFSPIILVSIPSLFFFSNNQAFSQVIKGQTVDHANNRLPYSTVTIFSVSKEKLKIINSDSTGSFAFGMLPSYKFIAASYMGNVSDTLTVKDKGLHILKVDNYTSIDTVNIDKDQHRVEHLADRFVFTPSRRFIKGSSALDAVKNAPLIDFNQKDESFSIIGKEGTTIYINNRKTDLPKEMILAELRSNPAENLESIEIITNPGSEYSANTSGGIININLKRMSFEGLFGMANLSTEQGPDNTTVFNGALNYRRRNFALRISPFLNRSYNRRDTEYEIGNAPDQSTSTIEYHRKYMVIGGGVGTDYDLSKRTLLSFNGFVSTVNGDANSNSRTIFSSSDRNTENEIRSDDKYFYNFGNVFIQHKFDNSGNRILVFNIDYNQFEKKNKDRISTVGIGMEPQVSNNRIPQDFFNISEKLDYIHKLGKQSRLSLGAMHSYSKLNSNPFYQVYGSGQGSVNLAYDYKETYLAAYGTLNTNIGKRFNMNLGIRAENTQYRTREKLSFETLDTTYLKLFPSVSAVYTINKNNVLSGTASRKIQRPSMEMLFPGRIYQNENYYTENDPFLLPSLRNNVELMYSNKARHIFSLGYNKATDAFAKFIVQIPEEDKILQRSTYINYGSYERWYATASTRNSAFKKKLDIVLSATFNLYDYEAKVAGNNNDIRNFNFNSILNLNFDCGKYMFVYSTLKFVSNSKTISQENFRNLTLFDLGARKSFGNLSVSIYLSDILNTSNVQTTSYLNTLSYNRYRFNYYTRSASLSLKHQFGNTKTKQVLNKSSANEEMRGRIN